MTIRYVRHISVAAIAASLLPGCSSGEETTGVIRAAAGDPATALIEVPIRWCAIKGSPAANDPGSLGEMNTDLVLWRRHERVSDRVWIPGANITFRSPFTTQIRESTKLNFPVIDDPKPPSAGGAGVEGDILDPNLDGQAELKLAGANCAAAWDALRTAISQELGITVAIEGPILVNARKLVDSGGAEAFIKGQGFWRSTGTTDQCANPPVIGALDGNATFAVFADYFYTKGFDPDDELAAHEIGHMLTLEHGNGLDDNGNGKFDGYGSFGGCDTAEDPEATPRTIMAPSTNNATLSVSSLQRTRARIAANKAPGKTLDPPGSLILGPVTSDHRTDPAADVTDPAVDLTSAGLIMDSEAQTVTVTHHVFGVLPPYPLSQYLLFIDQDNNPSTGGAPSTLGFTTSFLGADLVTQVRISRGGSVEFPERVITPTVWKYQSGTFVQVVNPAILAEVSTARMLEGGTPGFDTVALTMPASVAGVVGPYLRIQAIAEDLFAGGQTDRLPPDPAAGLDLSVEPPLFPVCAVSPDPARPGTATNVEVTGLTPNGIAKVVLGDDMVASGPIDSAGNASINFGIPATARTGPRLLTVGVMGNALTADCSVEVAGTPAPSIPIAIDIRPTSCPNPLNVRSPGVIPVAIVGSSTLDVTRIDPALVTLNGVAPLRWSLRDVATPYSPLSGKTSPTQCHTAGADGITDLVFQFDGPTLVAALGTLQIGQVLVMSLNGYLKPSEGGSPLSGEDVMIVRR